VVLVFRLRSLVFIMYPAGPYAVNGVPLRRLNQAYVIATSTKVDISGVKLPENVNDAFFKAEKKHLKQGKEEFAALVSAKAGLPEDKKKLQAAVDAGFKLDDTLKAYLKDRFTLSKDDKPHEMKF
jgi:large subunit ribosomal protein L6e